MTALFARLGGTDLEASGGRHPGRKEIARYLLSRGLDPVELVPDAARAEALVEAAAAIAFPAGLAPSLRR